MCSTLRSLALWVFVAKVQILLVSSFIAMMTNKLEMLRQSFLTNSLFFIVYFFEKKMTIMFGLQVILEVICKPCVKKLQ